MQFIYKVGPTLDGYWHGEAVGAGQVTANSLEEAVSLAENSADQTFLAPLQGMHDMVYNEESGGWEVTRKSGVFQIRIYNKDDGSELARINTDGSEPGR